MLFVSLFPFISVVISNTCIFPNSRAQLVRDYFSSYDFAWDAMGMFLTTEKWFVSSFEFFIVVL